MRRECRERFPRHWLKRKPLVSDPGMHHGTYVTHVSWYMSGSLTRGGGENLASIPGACATRNFKYLARCPCWTSIKSHVGSAIIRTNWCWINMILSDAMTVQGARSSSDGTGCLRGDTTYIVLMFRNRVKCKCKYLFKHSTPKELITILWNVWVTDPHP